jgi:hypothetical protein
MITDILNNLNTLLRSDILNLENINLVYYYYKTTPKQRYFEEFLKNIIDIHCFYRDERICSPLIDILDK